SSGSSSSSAHGSTGSPNSPTSCRRSSDLSRSSRPRSNGNNLHDLRASGSLNDELERRVDRLQSAEQRLDAPLRDPGAVGLAARARVQLLEAEQRPLDERLDGDGNRGPRRDSPLGPRGGAGGR